MYQLHPRNKFVLLYDRLPTDIILYISSFLKITERLFHLPSHLEHDIFSCLNECRHDTTKYATSYTVYYDDITTKLKWNKNENYSKSFIEYNTNNDFFSTHIGISHSNNENPNLICDRCMFIRIMFHDTKFLYMGKKRKSRLKNIIHKFQEKGFIVEEDALYFPICNYFYISKTIPIEYADNKNVDEYSIKNCIKVLLEMHKDVSQIFFSI